ncbi:hypothetical protein DW094_10290 [Ruminococcaceae bacterium AM07-15]|nr:hypothetical protein DW094_10290 [Ruminococcaceae bacterium AM07-15]
MLDAQPVFYRNGQNYFWFFCIFSSQFFSTPMKHSPDAGEQITQEQKNQLDHVDVIHLEKLHPGAHLLNKEHGTQQAQQQQKHTENHQIATIMIHCFLFPPFPPKIMLFYIN